MDFARTITKTYKSAEAFPVNDRSKLVLMSDCHRGDGSWGDDFARNGSIYYAALEHYSRSGFTYIEIGDGDELWENRGMKNILDSHREVFALLSRLFEQGRFHMLYGNHDMVKKYRGFAKRRGISKKLPLFEKLAAKEAIILKHEETGGEALVLHGHQADPLNSRYWKLARLLVRYLWGPLENFGVNDPTRAARNSSRRGAVEKRLIKWAKETGTAVIAGHTHRPVFPAEGEVPYFNDGSGVHPYCVTALEIEDGQICLVRWCVGAAEDGYLLVRREVIGGPERLEKYF